MSQSLVKETTIESWQHFNEVTDEFIGHSAFKTPYFFRGQCDHRWTLVPKLGRCLPDLLNGPMAERIEAECLRKFQREAHLGSSARKSTLPREKDLLGWWSLMQHYGAPTRLLDWSRSPTVAAYFAVTDLWKEDGALWVLNIHRIFDVMRDFMLRSGEEDSRRITTSQYEHVYTLTLNSRFDRFVAQQGAFTVSTSVRADHFKNFSQIAGALEKVVIPARLKPEFLKRLHLRNVNGSTLFPGLDGLGRTVSDLANLEVLLCKSIVSRTSTDDLKKDSANDTSSIPQPPST